MKNALKIFKDLKKTRLKEVSDECNSLINILEECMQTPVITNLNRLIDFSTSIFEKIDWENSNDKNIEYMIILVEILNIFLVNNSKISINNFEISKNDFSRVINIIEAFRR